MKKYIYILISILIIIIFVLPQDSIHKYFNFQKWKLSINKETKEKEVSLVAVGDISFSRGVESKIKKENNVHFPLLKIFDYLSSADITFGNLETPITEGRHILNNEMVFRSNPDTVHALKKAGFDILSLANNHTMNFDAKGLLDTINYLAKKDILSIGAGKNKIESNSPKYIIKNNIKFAFLAHDDISFTPPSYEATNNNPGISFMNIIDMEKSIKIAKENADYVIVSMHSGNEYVEKPNDIQVNFAHKAIDAGADLILGHHPHVVQTIEKYKGKYIFYSLGNFIFDQDWSEETKEGLVVKIYFTKKDITKIELLPVKSYIFTQPEKAKQDIKEKILARLNFPLDNQKIIYFENNQYVEENSAVIYTAKPKQAINNKTLFNDLNNNGIQEIYTLEKGQVYISENNTIIYQTPSNWWVKDIILKDSTNDNKININLSVFKAGKYEKYKPFWEERDLSVKNHFFVFELLNNNLKPIWQSSSLNLENQEIIFADINHDQENELITIEKGYNEKYCQNNKIGIWKWDGWGFKKEWESTTGNYCNLEIEVINGLNYIKTDSFNLSK